MNTYIENLASVRVLRQRLAQMKCYCASERAALILDTNVLLDIYYWKDPTALLLVPVMKKCQPVLTEETIEELADVLSREHFALSESEQIQLLYRVCNDFSLAKVTTSAPVRCRDNDDQKFLNLAYCLSPSILVSKDKRVLKAGKGLLKHGVRVLRIQDVLLQQEVRLT